MGLRLWASSHEWKFVSHKVRPGNLYYSDEKYRCCRCGCTLNRSYAGNTYMDADIWMMNGQKYVINEPKCPGWTIKELPDTIVLGED